MKHAFRFVLGTTLLSIFGLVSCGGNSNFPGSGTGDFTDADFHVTEVDLNETFKELQVDEELTLSAVVTLEEGYSIEDVDVKWTISSYSVISMEVLDMSATITAVKPGTAYVTVMAGLKKASCQINVIETVVPPDPVDPVDPFPPGPGPVDPGDFMIELSYESRSLKPGESFKLTATTTEPVLITWSSDNNSVASVDNDGFVSAISVGTATITAAAAINSINYSADCIVTVTEEGGGEEYKNINVYFFIDYNNVDPNDTTGSKLLAKFKWYGDRPISESGEVPDFKVNDPATDAKALDPAFPYFIGWSSHTIIDTKDDLWDMDKDLIGPSLSFIYFYGIWSDKRQEDLINEKEILLINNFECWRVNARLLWSKFYCST